MEECLHRVVDSGTKAGKLGLARLDGTRSLKSSGWVNLKDVRIKPSPPAGIRRDKTGRQMYSSKSDGSKAQKSRPEAAILLNKVAKRTGLEPATSSVTGWRSNRTELPLPDLGWCPCLTARPGVLIHAFAPSGKKKSLFLQLSHSPAVCMMMEPGCFIFPIILT